MTQTWKIRSTVAAAFLTASMQACSLSGGPIGGMVLDKETNQPIPGVIVVARWFGDYTQFVQSSSACYHVETTRTDASGRYEIPRWTRAPEIEDLRFSSAGNAISFFKAGYMDLSLGTGGTSYMQRFAGSNKEYFEKVLNHRRWLCAQAGASSNHLYRLYKAAAADASSRAETPDQRLTVLFLQRLTEESLVNTSKPTRLLGDTSVNVDPRDSLPPEE
jgi:hypothetical protein